MVNRYDRVCLGALELSSHFYHILIQDEMENKHRLEVEWLLFDIYKC